MKRVFCSSTFPFSVLNSTFSELDLWNVRKNWSVSNPLSASSHPEKKSTLEALAALFLLLSPGTMFPLQLLALLFISTPTQDLEKKKRQEEEEEEEADARAGERTHSKYDLIFKRGDLLEVPRTLFTHFGIYLGGGRWGVFTFLQGCFLSSFLVCSFLPFLFSLNLLSFAVLSPMSFPFLSCYFLFVSCFLSMITSLLDSFHSFSFSSMTFTFLISVRLLLSSVAHFIPDIMPVVSSDQSRIKQMVTNSRLLLGVLTKVAEHPTIKPISCWAF